MKKLLLSLGAALLLGSANINAQTRPATVIITAGQSNADGRAYVANLPSYLKSGYRYENYANVTSESKTAFGSMSFTNRWSFSDVTNYFIDKQEMQPFYYIKCAYGGTAIAPGVTVASLPIWYCNEAFLDTAKAYRGNIATGNSLSKSLCDGFDTLAVKVLSKLTNGYDVKAVLWHQGESDRNASGSYYTNFKTLIQYFRDRIYATTGKEKDKTLPFFFGTVSHSSKEYSATVEAAQLQVAKDMENVYYLDLHDASLLSDALHFDSAWSEYIGKKMYNMMVQQKLLDGDTLVVSKPGASHLDSISVANDRAWDFTQAWSSASTDALAADNAHWTANSGTYTLADALTTQSELATSAGMTIAETAGLYFDGKASTISVTPGQNISILAAGTNLSLPQVKPGQYVTITAQPADASTAGCISISSASSKYLDVIQGGTNSTKKVKNIWWFRDTYEDPANLTFSVSCPMNIYQITVSDAAPATDEDEKYSDIIYQRNVTYGSEYLWTTNDVAAWGGNTLLSIDVPAATDDATVRKGLTLTTGTAQTGISISKTFDIGSGSVVRYVIDWGNSRTYVDNKFGYLQIGDSLRLSYARHWNTGGVLYLSTNAISAISDTVSSDANLVDGHHIVTAIVNTTDGTMQKLAWDDTDITSFVTHNINCKWDKVEFGVTGAKGKYTDNFYIRAINISKEGGSSTGISDVEDVKPQINSPAMFNLQGQRILSPRPGTVYICDGKKMVKK